MALISHEKLEMTVVKWFEEQNFISHLIVLHSHHHYSLSGNQRHYQSMLGEMIIITRGQVLAGRTENTEDVGKKWNLKGATDVKHALPTRTVKWLQWKKNFKVGVSVKNLAMLIHQLRLWAKLQYLTLFHQYHDPLNCKRS